MAALARTDLLSEIMPWLVALLGLVVVGAIVIAAARRRYRGDDDPGVPFTLDDLRRLHAAGRLTDDEFARAREAMIAALRPKAPEPSTDAGGPDVDPPAPPGPAAG